MRAAVAILLAFAPAPAPAAAATTELQAVDLVFKAIHRLYPREPLHCFIVVTEDSSRRTFELAVRENHKRGCGGDPGVMPVRDRFRVTRSPLGLWRWDAPGDTYRRCQLSRAISPTCPRFSYE